ncbi:MAG: pyruvate dehydrogenase complex E1 component subunit beta [Candidatus Methylomirabilis oxygeniifera]|uniref:Pyruvate dehydrogenase E1 component subunit beta n=1 Tax=Methylomirabilis oxygeniifera TaxID=671143 RepID=D5MFX6_METO1|nr:MAG: pyruvate dehydrogenase complex E1 component subunit beta [Candidatus Methylomirabilis oxyfera]CBE68657.1 Pyruvate dehydrogenase E1 component subunit beta [Candidatus Methylomirabilis oxyfera]
MAIITYREALNQALREEMRRDPRVFLMGEEVGLYQGAYKVSQGLLEEFGPKRVIDTPISEAGFTGVGIGAAMVGLRPIVEMMTFNFALVAIDQIVNQAAKILYMSGGQYNVPMVIRGPGGPAHQLAAQHSQSMESYFYHVPGLKIVRPGTPRDAKGLLKSAIRDDDPVIFIESELLYGTKGEVPDGDYTIPLGVGEIKREGRDVTIVAYSTMLLLALQAAEDLEKEGISVEVVDPRTLRPLDTELIIESIKKTNRAVVMEAGAGFGGIGTVIGEIISEQAFDYLDAPVERVTGANAPTPYAKNLERAKAPSKERVVAAVKKVLAI